MFYFAEYAIGLRRSIAVCAMRFPHSDIPGSKVATHLPEAFRRYAASFIAFSSLGIHHSPLLPTIPMLTLCSACREKLRTMRLRVPGGKPDKVAAQSFHIRAPTLQFGAPPDRQQRFQISVLRTNAEKISRIRRLFQCAKTRGSAAVFWRDLFRKHSYEDYYTRLVDPVNRRYIKGNRLALET